MSDRPEIKLKDDGPLLAANIPSLKDANGDALPDKPMQALCRCGQSANKPFCDGSHQAAGFKSASDTSRIRNTPIEYTGEVEGSSVTVSYTPVLCSHAGACSAAAGDIFKPSVKPWVQPEKGRMSELLDAVANCPSGALRLKAGSGEPQHLTDGTVEIAVQANGPYLVKNIALDAEFNGAGASRTKYVLCRCGLSKNKPFCDGTHYDEGWKG